MVLAHEGYTGQNKEASTCAAQVRLSHTTSMVADDRRSGAVACSDSFHPLLPTQLNDMFADFKAVPKNLIIDPHWVSTVAHVLTRVALAKKQQDQVRVAVSGTVCSQYLRFLSRGKAETHPTADAQSSKCGCTPCGSGSGASNNNSSAVAQSRNAGKHSIRQVS